MRFSGFLKKVFGHALNLVFPNDIKCIFCDRDLNKFSEIDTCDHCISSLPFNIKHKCLICDDQILEKDSKEKSDNILYDLNIICQRCKDFHPKFDLARATFIYKEEVARVVLKFKNQSAKYLAKPMARYMTLTYLENELNADIVIPVPLHSKDRKNRGFNQSEILASLIAKNLNLEYNDQILFKSKHTEALKTLSANQRFLNIKEAFSINCGELLKGKNVLLVDDVITTGATSNACAIKLKRYCNKVYVLCFARTILEKL